MNPTSMFVLPMNEFKVNEIIQIMKNKNGALDNNPRSNSQNSN